MNNELPHLTVSFMKARSNGFFWFLFLFFKHPILCLPGGSVIKNLPAVQETPILSVGWEDPLEKKMATHSSTLAWEIPGMEVPGGLQSMVAQSLTLLSD